MDVMETTGAVTPNGEPLWSVETVGAALLALLQNAGVDPQPITEENDGRERMRL